MHHKKKDQALKIQWINQLYTGDSMLNFLAHYNIAAKIQNELFWQCNFHIKDIEYISQSKGFWRSVVWSWAQFNCHELKDIEQINQQVLWFNSHIRIGMKPVFIASMYNNGILYVSNIFNDNTKNYIHLRSLKNSI